jgi:flavorubredoxin
MAGTCRFDDECPLDIVFEEARKYYANIVLPYGKQVQKALEAAGGLEMDMIAPSHGVIWRSHIPEIIKEYVTWSGNKTENKAVIVYDTMWHSTKKIAYAVADGFEACGIPAALYSLETNHISDIMTDIITSKYICVGSPTLNNGILPTVSSFLTYMKGLAPQNRTGFAFGSYGWGGQSVGQIEEILQTCGFDLLENIRIQYVPDAQDLDKITEQIVRQLSG